MSRRRPKPRPRTLFSFRDLDIICTGRRTHSRNRLGRVRVWGADTNTASEVGRVSREEGPEPFLWDPYQQGRQDQLTHMTRPYRCERCGLDVPLKDSTADDILIGLADVGESSLDISALHVS
jgi:hypothetical protein